MKEGSISGDGRSRVRWEDANEKVGLFEKESECLRGGELYYVSVICIITKIYSKYRKI